MEDLILFQDGFVLLFHTFFIEFERIVLVFFVVIAALFDIKQRRIPNRLVFSGALAALGFHMLSPYGIGFFSSLGGLGIGLAVFLPLYVARTMGAGDVKLMAMVGAFLGPASTLGAVITTLLAGGILSIAVAIRKRSLQRVVKNIRFMMTHALVAVANGDRTHTDMTSISDGKLPYGIAIATGTIAHLLLSKNGMAFFS